MMFSTKIPTEMPPDVGYNSYKTVIFYFFHERMWKECYEIICIVEDDVRNASQYRLCFYKSKAEMRKLGISLECE